MSLREAHETIIKDILVNRELGFDKKIDVAMAGKIAKSLMDNDNFLMQLEEVIADEIGSEVDEIADEFGLYEEEE